MRNPLIRNHLLSLFSAPLIWSAHFLVCYVLVSLACTMGLGGARIGIAIATAVALALLAYTGVANYRKWKQARADAQHSTTETSIGAFFALNSMMLCVLSAVALVWVAFPSAMLPLCLP